MKKIFIGIVLMVLLIVPIAGASDIQSINMKDITKQTNFSKEDFTHTVFVEACTQTWCPPCATAAAVMHDIYSAGTYDFNYVALVSDMNLYAAKRSNQLEVHYIPDYVFDGDFTRYVGASDLPDEYINRLVSCGAREVPDIDMSVDVSWLGLGILKITVTVQNNEPENYNGYLRGYVVEKLSRWNTQSGQPYHHAVIGMPFDRDLTVVSSLAKPLANTYTFTRTWFGPLHNFSDIDIDNIEVIAAVYDGDTGYVVETASGEPTSAVNIRQSSNLLILKFLERYISHFPLLNRLLNLY
jgi:hypothetical protein